MIGFLSFLFFMRFFFFFFGIGQINLPDRLLVHLIARVTYMRIGSQELGASAFTHIHSNILRLRGFLFSDWFTCTDGNINGRRTVTQTINGDSVILANDTSAEPTASNCFNAPVIVQDEALHDRASITIFPCSSEDGMEYIRGFVTACDAMPYLAPISTTDENVCIFLVNNSAATYSFRSGVMFRLFTVFLRREYGQTSDQYYATAHIKWSRLNKYTLSIQTDEFRVATNSIMSPVDLYRHARRLLCDESPSSGFCVLDFDADQLGYSFPATQIANANDPYTVGVANYSKKKTGISGTTIGLAILFVVLFVLAVILAASSASVVDRAAGYFASAVRADLRKFEKLP